MIGAVDGHDADAVDAAIAQAKRSADKPTLIVCKTTIGKGSPNRAGTAKAHGEALGADEIKLDARRAGLEPRAVRDPRERLRRTGTPRRAAPRLEAAWDARFAAYRAAHPRARRRVRAPHGAASCRRTSRRRRSTRSSPRTPRPRPWPAARPARSRSRPSPQALPELLGGSADLTGSNLTNTKRTPALRFDADRHARERRGRHINYGVREFGMAAVMNGVALHGGFIPYGGTFLTFSDYSRNAIRMAALMKQRVIHVFTHDSHRPRRGRPDAPERRARGQPAPDPGPGRLAPGRHRRDRRRLGRARCDNRAPAERAAAVAPEPALRAQGARWTTSAKGAYVLAEPSEVGLKKKAQAVIIATGSEVQLALHAQQLLAAARHRGARGLDAAHHACSTARAWPTRRACCRPGCRASRSRWASPTAGGSTAAPRWSASTRYGESAPAGVLFKHFGFTRGERRRHRAQGPVIQVNARNTCTAKAGTAAPASHAACPGSLSYFENSKKGQLGCKP